MEPTPSGFISVSYTHLDVYKRQEVFHRTAQTLAEEAEVDTHIRVVARLPRQLVICLLYTSRINGIVRQGIQIILVGNG